MQTPLARAIRSAREALGMGKTAFADAVGVSRQAVGAWEAGRRPPRQRRTCQRLVDLGVPVSMFPHVAGLVPKERQADPVVERIRSDAAELDRAGSAAYRHPSLRHALRGSSGEPATIEPWQRPIVDRMFATDDAGRRVFTTVEAFR